MACRSLNLSFYVFITLIILLLRFISITSRPLHDIHRPVVATTAIAVSSFDKRRARIRPPAPASLAFSINRYKYVEMEAFRPTSPGHSPGVGHKEPPGSPQPQLSSMEVAYLRGWTLQCVVSFNLEHDFEFVFLFWFAF